MLPHLRYHGVTISESWSYRFIWRWDRANAKRNWPQQKHCDSSIRKLPHHHMFKWALSGFGKKCDHTFHSSIFLKISCVWYWAQNIVEICWKKPKCVEPSTNLMNVVVCQPSDSDVLSRPIEDALSWNVTMCELIHLTGSPTSSPTLIINPWGRLD